MRVQNLVLVALLVLPAGVAGQSLFGTGSLGVPVEPLDARARALGSVGTGLFGSSLLPTDPASSNGLLLPTITATLQPQTGSVQGGGLGSDIETTRFPHLGVAVPVGEYTVMTLTYGAFLDQRWSSTTERVLDLAGDPVRATDTFSSDGGVAALRIGLARRVGPSVGVAVSVGAHTGSFERVFSRDFNVDDLGVNVVPFSEAGRWQVTGATAAAGVKWDPNGFLRVSGSVVWSGDLTAAPFGETKGAARKFSLPLEVRGGASARLTSALSLTAGFAVADWTASGDDLESGVEAGTVVSVGGGIEWSGPTLLNRVFPLRLGYRWGRLPFEFRGEQPTESTLSGGLGMNLAQFEDVPLARLDAALERVERSAGPVSESLWRWTFSLSLSGN